MVYQKRNNDDNGNVGTLDNPNNNPVENNNNPPVVSNNKKVVEDDGMRTILHGWGKEPPTKKWLVDTYECVGGVIRDVPAEAAEMMQKGLRRDKDGKLVRAYGRIKIQAILPSNATEADFIRATGITPMPINKFAAMLQAFDANAIREALGDDRARELANALLGNNNK